MKKLCLKEHVLHLKCECPICGNEVSVPLQQQNEKSKDTIYKYDYMGYDVWLKADGNLFDNNKQKEIGEILKHYVQHILIKSSRYSECSLEKELHLTDMYKEYIKYGIEIVKCHRFEADLGLIDLYGVEEQ